MGTRGAYVKYRKQKLNTNSSTETDIFGLDNFLTQVIWNQYFLKEQGYDIHENNTDQDNQSAIKLDKNGRQ